ncbi:vomeronasal type-2 receptor 26-like [Tiliqua scincoides]|uniref:vomeronasal type-2 receptor 26-like n=1 Tax=Tiliqua scincoides TaxID=71010 RepID=UPI00346311DE
MGLLPQAVSDAQMVNCRLWRPQIVHHQYHQPGDLIIGGIVFQNMFEISRSTFKQNPPQPQLSRVFIQNYQHILALEFAVKEINENLQLLPNITLGFSIYDSYVEARWTYHAILQLISPKDRFVPNYQCDIQGNLMAVTEELTSDVSHQVPEVLGHFKIPQVLYGSAVVTMDKNQAISVYREEPNGVHQYRGILQLLLHFNWTWIGFIAADDMNLQGYFNVLFQEFSKHGICFAILESFSSLANEKSAMNFYDKVINHNANVSVFYGDIRSMLFLRMLLSIGKKGTNQKPKGKVWILTAQMAIKYSVSNDDWDIQDFHGSLSFAIHSNELPGFQGFLQSRYLSSCKEDGFYKDFWENALQCTFSSSPPGHRESAACTGEKRLESLPNFFPTSITSQSYTLYNAVYAVALALHAMYVSKSNRAKMEGETRRFQNQQPWQLHHFLKKVSFNNSAGDQISFDQNEELIAGFDIINQVTFPNQSVVKVKVGRLDLQAPPSEAISINEDSIVWPSWFNQKKKEGELFCCYDCVPCPEGKVSDMEDMADCFTCPSDHYPNKDQTSCIPKAVIFLSYEEPLGIALAICAVLLSLVTALVLRLFVKHRDSPIVKINNQSLTYTLLISLWLCFLCPLLHIGQPNKVICILRQNVFSIIFTMTMSSVLAKTVIVVLAFKATQPGSTPKNWLGKRLASSIILPCIMIEVVICIVRITISPTFPDMHSSKEEIILECKNSSSTILFSETIYFKFLSTVSFIMAFLARKLPDAFNEAKLISSSMVVFSCVWNVYFLNFLFTNGKLIAAMDIFCVLTSSAALLGFMFFPKCYIILWKHQLNSREQLKKWKR